ncbi:MAG: DUF2878 domain-containing protein [Pseudomonadales bacterium]|nr:DUF2878 domain-containing protein [Pseudomonadales bacterium]
MTRSNLYNALLFNVAWLLCVKFGDAVAVLTCITVLVLHFCYITDNKKEWMLLCQVLLLGILIDSLLIALDVLVSVDGSLLPPLWLSALWLLFASTLNHCFSWLQGRWFLAVLLGATAGPFSYWAGTNLSDVSLGLPLTHSLLAIALCWSVVFPVCLLLAKRNKNQHSEYIF